MSQSRPDPNRYVIQTPAPDRAAERLRRLGEVERFDGKPELLLLHHAASDPRDGWLEVVSVLEPSEGATPVLLDEDGGEHFPTGEILVRFETAPTDDELARFAGEHNLEAPRRNAYAPEQASFRPRGRSYLPDLVGSIGQASGVRRAWAGILSRFRRGA